MSPWVSRPCLDLVYLVFHQSPEMRRRKEEEGKKGGEEGEEVGEEEEEEGGYLTPLQPLHCALRYSKELPPFGNFSKAPVMVFEAAIKNKCFYPLPSCFVRLNALQGWVTFHLWAVCMRGRETEGSHSQKIRTCIFPPHLFIWSTHWDLCLISAHWPKSIIMCLIDCFFFLCCTYFSV